MLSSLDSVAVLTYVGNSRVVVWVVAEVPVVAVSCAAVDTDISGIAVVQVMLPAAAGVACVAAGTGAVVS